MRVIDKIGHTNAGRYSTSLAAGTMRHGREDLDCQLFVRDPAKAEAYNTVQIGPDGNFKENHDYLPGIHLPDALNFSSDLRKVVKDAGIVFVGVPSRHIQAVGEMLVETLTELNADERTIVCSLTKGLIFKDGSILTPVDYLREVMGEQRFQYAYLGGGGFDTQIATGHVPKLVAAAEAVETGDALIQTLDNGGLKVVSTRDQRGAELCGGLKNTFAIAMGIAHGVGLKTTEYASVYQQSIEEMAQILTRLGGNPLTMFTPAGIADFDLSTHAGREDVERVKEFFGIVTGLFERNIKPLLIELDQLTPAARPNHSGDDILAKDVLQLQDVIKAARIQQRDEIVAIENRIGMPRVGRNMQLGIGLSLGHSVRTIEESTLATYEGKTASLAFYELVHAGKSLETPLLNWLVAGVFSGKEAASGLMPLIARRGGGYRVDEVIEHGYGTRPSLRKLLLGEEPLVGVPTQF